MPEEFRPRLFQEYSRAAGTHARGTGLGLFVVRALAEAQGGAVTYAPREPHGVDLHPAAAVQPGLRAPFGHDPVRSTAALGTSQAKKVVEICPICYVYIGLTAFIWPEIAMHSHAPDEIGIKDPTR